MNIHVWSPAFTGFGGGITAFSGELAIGLKDLGHELRLYSKLDRPGKWQGVPLWGAADCPGVLQVPGFAGGVLAACARYRPDHVISSHVNFGPLAHWAHCVFGTPFTLVAHGVDVHAGLSRARVAALRAADRVFAVSSWTRQRVLDLGGIHPRNVMVVTNTLNDSNFTVAARPAELAKRYDLQLGERVVLTVARLDPDEGYKGYDRVLEALPAVQRACGRVRFILVGKGADHARIKAMAQELAVERSVTFTGFVPDAELADHYRLADVFAMPSTGEGFGIVFLEAMACGTPVLAGNRDGSVDALDAGRLGCLVDPTDVGAIAKGVIALLTKQGPELWFNRDALHGAVIQRFGRVAFREALRNALAP